MLCPGIFLLATHPPMHSKSNWMNGATRTCGTSKLHGGKSQALYEDVLQACCIWPTRGHHDRSENVGSGHSAATTMQVRMLGGAGGDLLYFVWAWPTPHPRMAERALAKISFCCVANFFIKFFKKTWMARRAAGGPPQKNKKCEFDRANFTFFVFLGIRKQNKQTKRNGGGHQVAVKARRAGLVTAWGGGG